MGWEMILWGVICIVIGVISRKYNMNGSYTAGKHMFKNSDANLEEKNLDFSDQNYYDHKGIFR